MIIIIKIYNIDRNMALQIALKVLNNLVEFNGFIFTLLIFGAYSYIVELDALLLTVM